MFINVKIVVVIIELFLEWFRLSVTSFCLFSHTLSFISSTLVVTGKQILLLLLYCVNGESGSSLLIESTDSMIIV